MRSSHQQFMRCEINQCNEYTNIVFVCVFRIFLLFSTEKNGDREGRRVTAPVKLSAALNLRCRTRLCGFFLLKDNQMHKIIVYIENKLIVVAHFTIFYT